MNANTVIVYASKHHGNTKKLVDAIAASDPENVERMAWQHLLSCKMHRTDAELNASGNGRR